MKKIYTHPMMDTVVLVDEDILTTSGIDDTFEDPYTPGSNT